MVTVITPRLTSVNGDLGTMGQCYFCLVSLQKFVEVPEAKYYWVEASDKQFKERNGCAVEVKLEIVYPMVKLGDIWIDFEFVITKHLKKLGVIFYGKSKVIYFRLWYQE